MEFLWKLSLISSTLELTHQQFETDHALCFGDSVRFLRLCYNHRTQEITLQSKGFAICTYIAFPHTTCVPESALLYVHIIIAFPHTTCVLEINSTWVELFEMNAKVELVLNFVVNNKRRFFFDAQDRDLFKGGAHGISPL